ncbi:tRNA dihydrouridine(20/20a) synthase DusA [Brunnivagina elsteri]|uniref:tRNA-dihydrouridine(20/20a) synthase n=1 Tax=Brunnivagina elsteri CCALA 953 TaxID=987040 RepID=A0A2A2TP08_9CYAN|nr:tRNA dihydrouridine(20/20a) synthase DusA [Calothrix elsteri]PAX60183.1 tRNA dihydrouridine(20/20a) synthase DusA [Calothrix elsteri CCALA 953]
MNETTLFKSKTSTRSSYYPLSVAPMMDRTDRHYRYFMRQITRRTLLYTEMVTTAAIMHGDREKLLGFSPEEKPLVLQVGGDKPKELAECAKIAAEMGYDEINLNVGCPSDRVQDGNFGACLMAQPQKVAECVAAMITAADIPVSVKHRIGIDECDRYEDMANFISIVAESGCKIFNVHARKAWLKGLSPKENRDVPPLRYADVHRLKVEFPDLFIEINGGLVNLEQIREQLQFVDAVMIGRAAYDNPYLFAVADSEFYGENTVSLTRHQVVEAMFPYIDKWAAKGLKLNKITRHMLQLFAGQPGTRAWKQHITEHSYRVGVDSKVIAQALALVAKPTKTESIPNV